MRLVTPEIGQIFWMVLMFIIVLIILKKFAWRPILNALKNREQSIEEALRSADKARVEMEKLLADNEKVMAEARKERDKMIKETKKTTKKMLNEAKNNAGAESKKIIAACWHSRILLVSYLYKGWNAAILVSRSKDGEIIARILEKQGHEAIRGSSTRGGLRALSRLIKGLKENKRPAVIIPDGPQGPRFIVQPGVIALAKKTGSPILPISYSAKKIKVFNSWDRFILPFPFTTCRIVYGNPVYVPQKADRETEAKCRIQLEAELNRITTGADNCFGHIIS